MKKKLAMFDMDGTLFVTKIANHYCYDTALKEHGFSMEYDYYVNYCEGRTYKDFIPQIIGENLELLQQIHARKQELYAKNVDKVIPNYHLFNIINGLSSEYYIALVTVASKKNTYDLLEYFNKKDVFDLILTRDDYIERKPSPECYKKAMQFFDITPENSIVFEDSDTGIEAAKNCGANVLVVNKIV